MTSTAIFLIIILMLIVRVPISTAAGFFPFEVWPFERGLKEAVLNRNPDYCNKINQEIDSIDYKLPIIYAQKRCQAQYAVETNDLEYCLSLSDAAFSGSGSYSQRDLCLQDLARKWERPDLCDLMPVKNRDNGPLLVEGCVVEAKGKIKNIAVLKDDQSCFSKFDCVAASIDCSHFGCDKAINKNLEEDYKNRWTRYCKNDQNQSLEYSCETPYARCIMGQCELSDTSPELDPNPMTYSDCIKFGGKLELGLECRHDAYAADDKNKFQQCLESGGELSQAYRDLNGQILEDRCALAFYNPDFVFPRNFNECINRFPDWQKKNIQKEGRCIIQVKSFGVHNKDIAEKFLATCFAIRGEQPDRDTCGLEFR